ncbi:hypothetical protein SARC_17418, partial [Sphaeroforma arctica JP610]
MTEDMYSAFFIPRNLSHILNSKRSLFPTDCTKETLCDLYEKVLEASHSQPDECARALVHGNYVSQLLAIFNTCESEGNTVLLTVIYQLIEVFFSLSSHDLYEHLLSAEHILDVIGALEYDPQ